MTAKFNEFERLVDFACGGRMERREIPEVTADLKAAKRNIMDSISLLSEGGERHKAFKELHNLMYRLYRAVYVLKKDEGKDKEMPVYISASQIANMVLCYDCKQSAK